MMNNIQILPVFVVTIVLSSCGNSPEPSSICTPDPDIEPEDCRFVPEGEIRDISSRQAVHELCQSPCTRGGHIIVSSVPGLEDLEALSRLKTVEVLTIQKNRELKSTSGLNLEGEIEWLTISENPSLRRLGGFENVNEMGNLTVMNNSNLANLKGLTGVRKFSGIQFEGNAIDSLAFIGDASVTDSFSISGEKGLREINSAPEMKELKYLSLSYNDNLYDVSGLTSIESVSKSIQINHNPRLPRCHIDEVLSQIDISDAHTLDILANGSGDCE